MLRSERTGLTISTPSQARSFGGEFQARLALARVTECRCSSA